MNNTYNRHQERKIVEKTISTGNPMSDEKYDVIKIKRKGIQISLEFPPKSARDQIIELEVKAIIASELKEKSRKLYIS